MGTIREQIAAVWESEVESGRADRRKPGEKNPAAMAAQTIRERRVCQIKADAVKQQFDDHPGKNGDGVLSVRTAQGEATIHRVEATTVDGVACVDVWTSNGLDPNYRLINPPMLVEDPAGSVFLRGRRFREDPIGAVAEVIAGQQRKGYR